MIIKIIAIILVIICLIWIFTDRINHSMAEELQEQIGINDSLVDGCEAFMKILILIRKNLSYTKLKKCPKEEKERIIDEVIQMIDDTETAYTGGKNGIHKQI